MYLYIYLEFYIWKSHQFSWSQPFVLNRQDPSIVLAAVSQDPSAIEFASQSLVSQQDFLRLGALGWFFQSGFLKSWGSPKHGRGFFHGKTHENPMKIYLLMFMSWKILWISLKMDDLGVPHPHFRTPPLFLILSGNFKVCELENHHLIFNQLSHHVCHRTGPWLHSYVK